jgi:hypothetical protein
LFLCWDVLYPATMGGFLSKPVTDKKSEDEEGAGYRVGASAMQGWRRGMEDAHLALLQVPGLKGVEVRV